jgi:hypothetical protein
LPDDLVGLVSGFRSSKVGLFDVLEHFLPPFNERLLLPSSSLSFSEANEV